MNNDNNNKTNSYVFNTFLLLIQTNTANKLSVTELPFKKIFNSNRIGDLRPRCGAPAALARLAPGTIRHDCQASTSFQHVAVFLFISKRESTEIIRTLLRFARRAGSWYQTNDTTSYTIASYKHAGRVARPWRPAKRAVVTPSCRFHGFPRAPVVVRFGMTWPTDVTRSRRSAVVRNVGAPYGFRRFTHDRHRSRDY